jgi:hypothetical protein
LGYGCASFIRSLEVCFSPYVCGLPFPRGLNIGVKLILVQQSSYYLVSPVSLFFSDPTCLSSLAHITLKLTRHSILSYMNDTKSLYKIFEYVYACCKLVLNYNQKPKRDPCHPLLSSAHVLEYKPKFQCQTKGYKVATFFSGFMLIGVLQDREKHRSWRLQTCS